MATKSDFSDEQWHELVYSVEDAMMFVSVANGAKFFEGVGEAVAAARFLSESAKTSPSTLVRDLALGIRGRDKQLGNDLSALEKVVLDRVAAGVEIVTAVAPDELDAYKQFILGVADATAEARNGIDDQEATAIEKIKSALL